MWLYLGILGLIGPFPLIECSVRCLGWLNLLLIRSSIWGCISRNNTLWSFRRFADHVDIDFLSFIISFLFHLLFYYRIQSLKIDYFLAPNALINTLSNKNQACEVNDLGIDQLLIVRRLKVINEPLDNFDFHHGRKHLSD